MKTDVQGDTTGNVDSWPFLYPNELHVAELSIMAGNLAQRVQGYRSTGRTAWLRELHRRLGGVFLRGRSGAEAVLKQIERATADHHNLFIDDVDFLLGVGREKRDIDPGGAEQVEEAVLTALNRLTGAGRVVVVSFMYLRTEDIAKSLAMSQLCEAGQKVELPAPWRVDWSPLLQRMLTAQFGRVLGDVVLLMSGVPICFDKVFLKAWIAEVLRLTGGHPGLLSAAFRGLAHDLAEAEQLYGVPLSIDARQHSVLLRSWLELQLSGEAMAPVRRRIASLRARPVAYEALVRAALAGGFCDLPIESAADIQPYVEEESLGYYDRSRGRLVVLGGLIEKTLGRGSVSLAPDPEAVSESGRVVAVQAGIERAANLSGQAWRIAQALYAAGGQPVQPSVLKDTSGARSIGAVRAIIQRIKSSLDEAGIRGIVGVQRGKGYYLLRSHA